ncbi:Hypothetical predicted protein [Podarcis lilfordi]|uniref:Uncharacterized protein n=1 Tax=Podarcis lilfordi TaxID=74358 RepID=A0AA35K044_9SAUR|nr:Hypothetical predicted protein [Podarcis lilfordi]
MSAGLLNFIAGGYKLCHNSCIWVCLDAQNFSTKPIWKWAQCSNATHLSSHPETEERLQLPSIFLAAYWSCQSELLFRGMTNGNASRRLVHV